VLDYSTVIPGTGEGFETLGTIASPIELQSGITARDRRATVQKIIQYLTRAQVGPVQGGVSPLSSAVSPLELS
jgi:hypothetical protein